MAGCLDGPSQLRITRMLGNDDLPLKHGEILRCDSDGNPSAVYTWQDGTTGRRLHDGQELIFDLCRHFDCGAQCDQNIATLTLQCAATVSGIRWTNSDHISTSFFLDLRSYNQTCGRTTGSTVILLCHVLATGLISGEYVIEPWKIFHIVLLLNCLSVFVKLIKTLCVPVMYVFMSGC